MSCKSYTHIAMFDRPYPPEKQAEGLAISQAIVDGHCETCGFCRSAPPKRILSSRCSPGVCGGRRRLWRKWRSRMAECKRVGSGLGQPHRKICVLPVREP